MRPVLPADDLRVLQSLYETRNTTRTAERLNKSQPGVSRVLSRLLLIVLMMVSYNAQH